MFYELRTYTCLPGKLPIVLKRFETATLGLFKKHGFRRGPLFTVAVGDDNLQIKYILEWDSHEQRDKAWVAFRNDPEWAKALAESEKDGPVVAKISNELLMAVPFSV
ncbi:NIPSNAP family protein [Hydrogenophaga sp.]|uniref:NIPSNAP family protein n=1 Tax=Hydrogenophaga sp. TaxID=1904254 RepID=UPI00261B2D55|nr:NIPSNAP family protein [Hydrogenophaga sp.]MCW5653783.1 NIPSNAP family protein [Hydrogenophaga sp.]